MTGLGIAITALSVAVLVVGFLRHKQRAFPSYGWVGVVIFVAAEWLMLRGVEPLATYFTPVAWTAYLLMLDAAVFGGPGSSPGAWTACMMSRGGWRKWRHSQSCSG